MPYPVEDDDVGRLAPRDTAGAGSKSVFENGVTQAAALIGAFGGMLGVLYAIGGAVMWLRFERVGIPADQAVALVPKADLLVIGLRVMVLPALATAAVLTGLASVRRGRRPRALRGPARIALLAAVVLLILVVPFSFGAFAWPVALLGLVAYWLRLNRITLKTGRKFPVWRIAVAGVLAAALISVARQTDPPTQLPSVQAFVTDLPGLNRTLGLATTRDRAAQPIELSGVLITANGSDLSVGDPTRGRIVTVPRSHVSSMIVGPPLDVRAPPESLLSRIIPGGTAWAVTPLEVWCVQIRYGWSQVLDACEDTARIVPAVDTLKLKNGTVRGIEVECPAGAPYLCRGYVALQALGTGAKGEPPTTTPVGYAVEPGATQPVPLRVGDWFAREYQADDSGRIHADVRLLLALAPKPDGVFFTTDARLAGKAELAEREASGDPKTGDPKTGDPKPDDPNAGNPDPGQSNSPDPNSGGTNGPDPDSGDSNSPDPDSGDPNSPDPGSGDPNSPEPGSGDPNSGEDAPEPPLSFGPTPPPSSGTEAIGPGITAG
jgi:hypothetical protein